MSSILILSTLIAVVISFLCSLAESLLLSINPLTLNHLRTIHPYAAESWTRLKKDVTRPITAILVLNTVAHTGGATIAGGAFTKQYGEEYIWLFSIGFTLIILFGTEILPKIIGVAFCNQLAPYAGPALEIIVRLLYPVVWFSERLFRGLLTTHQESEQITTADLITLVSIARSGKAINLEQENMIVNVVRLSHTLVTATMIPLARIRFLPKDASPDMLLKVITESGHTRYPLSRSNLAQDIDAYIVTKKVCPATHHELATLLSQAKPIRTVDRRATLMTVLHTMIQHKEHLIAVVDAQKQCVGIVTLEDIASELLSADIEQFK